MFVRRKTRNRIIIFVLLLLIIVYWRGAKAYAKQNHLVCQYHFVYAVCKQIGTPTTIPSIWAVLSAGVKF
jgi:hypothetical protein